MYKEGSCFFEEWLWLCPICLAKLNHVCVFHPDHPSTLTQCLLNWRIWGLEVNLNVHSSWLRCSVHGRSYQLLHASIKFPLVASEASFPDNIACCGNRNLKISGDTHLALSIHTCYIFYIWTSRTSLTENINLFDGETFFFLSYCTNKYGIETDTQILNLTLTWLLWLFYKYTRRDFVITALLHHCHLVLNWSAYSTCRFAERLFLFLFSLVIFRVWQNSCAKNVLESTYTSSVWT